VTRETGFKIPARNPDRAVQELAAAITRLAQDANLRMQMGQAGQSLIAQSYNWEAKAKVLTKTYREILACYSDNFGKSPNRNLL
jgi:glycosyltransferase involved in cell wall biosynthesis